MPLANGYKLMASDALASMGRNVNFGNSFHICIDVEGEKEADRVFAALSNGGEIEMPMNKTFFGSYFGMCKDKFDVNWMINFEMNSPQKK